MQIFATVISVILIKSLQAEKYVASDYTDPECSKKKSEEEQPFSYYYYVQASDETSVCIKRFSPDSIPPDPDSPDSITDSIKWVCNPDDITVDALHYYSPDCSKDLIKTTRHATFYPKYLFRGDCFFCPTCHEPSDAWFKFDQAVPSSTLPSCLKGDVGYILSEHKEDCSKPGEWSSVLHNPVMMQGGSEVCFTSLVRDVSSNNGLYPWAPALVHSEAMTCVGDKIYRKIFDGPSCEGSKFQTHVYEKSEWQRLVNGDCINAVVNGTDDQGKSMIKFEKAIAHEHLPNCLEITPDLYGSGESGADSSTTAKVSEANDAGSEASEAKGSQRAPLMLPAVSCILLSLPLPI